MADDAHVEASHRRRFRLLAPAGIEPLDPRDGDPVERQVYRAIRGALMAGGVPPGGKLSSRGLAEALGVSATPVREALKRLEAEGAVESRDRSAIYVLELTREAYREVLEVRLRLEGLAARQSAAGFDRAAMKQAVALDKRLRGARGASEFLSWNFRFHFFIYQRANSPYLLSLIENTWLKIGPSLNRFIAEVEQEETYGAHARILDALDRNDGDAAEAALRDDLVGAAEVIQSLLPTAQSQG